jgi:serine/threonine protein kinase
MPFAAGDNIGPYQIVGLLGKGGMGEVYRARDAKLKREVAVKILPETFAHDADRMARFRREAELLASLNHPGIATIYGLEGDAIVMELIEGEALSGPLPVETALQYARQIVDALGYAHDRGVIHRDLKPANIKVTPEGTLKLLDFGLAKAMDDPATASDPSNSPTLTLGHTRAGEILGTAGYMSPEQARGRLVDKRADIWSFGVVFYEILTGQRLFQGEDVADTLAKVIQAKPNLDNAPASVQRLLKSCLEKDANNRLRDIGDAWQLLEEEPTTTASQQRFGSATQWIITTVAIVIAVAFGFAWRRASQSVEEPLVRLDVDLGENVALYRNSTGNSIAISPDGMRLVYLSGPAGSEPELFTRRFDQTKAIELPGTQGARSPFFSPDGQWIGFCAPRTSKIPVEGGPILPLIENTFCQFGGPSWGEDGTIALSGQGGMIVIPPGKGRGSGIVQNGGFFPKVLPGGKAVLFTTGQEPDSASIGVMTLADGKTRIIVPRGTTARYAASGHLIYTSKSTLFAVPFDLNKLETRGNPVPILDDVAYHRSNGVAQFDVSPAGHGLLVYWKGGAFGGARDRGNATIQQVGSGGKTQTLIAESGTYESLHLSPDGKRLLLIEGEGDVWVYDLERNDVKTRLTSDGKHSFAVWGPDAHYVIFDSANGLSWVRADGSSPAPQLLLQSDEIPVPTSYTQVGKRLAYFVNRPSQQIWTVQVEEQNGQMKAGKPERFLDSQLTGIIPTFSPDGRWLAYETFGQQANSERREFLGRGRGLTRGRADREVIVRPFPPPAAGHEHQVHIANNGRAPHWSQNGQELFYQSGDQIMVATYTVNKDELVPGNARLWASPPGITNFAWPWDLTPNGKGVVVTMRIETPEPPQEPRVHTVVILQNFFDELRRRAPLGN